MDSSGREMAPPSFYLSALKTGRLWLFSDVPVLPESYNTALNVVPLPGMNSPLVMQGYGNGRSWSLEAKMNAWNKFLADEATTSARDPGSSVYDEYLEILQFIEDNGPSPLMVLHALGREQMVVALQSFNSEIALQEDTFLDDGQRPSTIPVSMTLVEVREYAVPFGGG